MSLRIPLILAASMGLSASSAQAGYTYSFTGVTNNNSVNTATGEAQLTVEVSEAGPNQVAFTFRNSGPGASSITDVYFENGPLHGIANITHSGGVSFSPGANPGNLPGGNTINFLASGGFTADSDPPAQRNGVNPGEWLMIEFDLLDGQTYQDTLNALALSLDNHGANVDGGLRIGIHVQGFAGGGSESFVNGDQVHPTPTPASLVLLASALPVFALGRAWRRRTPVAT